MVVLRRDGQNISGDIINFLSSDELSYPQLTRLYLEFDFNVVEVTHVEESPASSRRYVLAYKGENAMDSRVVTPEFESLHTLETYIEENVLDILQRTVFETTQIGSTS